MVPGVPTLTRNHLLAEEGTGFCLLVRLQGKGEGSLCHPYQARKRSHSMAQQCLAVGRPSALLQDDPVLT